jgi:flavodoxin
MKSLIVYSSKSGNTKKLADVIYEALSGEKTISPVSELPETVGYDFIAVGFWLQAGKPDPAAEKYLARITNGKRLFLFATHGAAKESGHAKTAMDIAKGLVPNAEIAGTFNCQGEVNPDFLQKAARKQPLPEWVKDAPDAKGHPDDADINTLKKIINDLNLQK